MIAELEGIVLPSAQRVESVLLVVVAAAAREESHGREQCADGNKPGAGHAFRDVVDGLRRGHLAALYLGVVFQDTLRKPHRGILPAARQDVRRRALEGKRRVYDRSPHAAGICLLRKPRRQLGGFAENHLLRIPLRPLDHALHRPGVGASGLDVLRRNALQLALAGKGDGKRRTRGHDVLHVKKVAVRPVPLFEKSELLENGLVPVDLVLAVLVVPLAAGVVPEEVVVELRGIREVDAILRAAAEVERRLRPL